MANGLLDLSGGCNAKLWGILDSLTVIHNRNRDKVSIRMD
ncbi:hypothetical protein Goari_003475, partial [Gossypium aridum]|nr:hypothetical protein [Gossypium aridum]